MVASGPVISVRDLHKIYTGDFHALKGVSLDIVEGEIFALLGPNGAGKTTLINIICGIARKSSGSVTVCGHDIVDDFRVSRACIGLVPQELATEAYEKVRDTVAFSRGLFGKPPDPGKVERVLRSLSLWDKKDNILITLSGGMKRRVAIAKALAHEPRVLFLDEPTAGVDVELRKEMWQVVRDLRASGVTIILTTHYIEEAEQIADRIGIINHGEIILVRDKDRLMQELGRKILILQLDRPLAALPGTLADFELAVGDGGMQLTYTYDTQAERTGITALLAALSAEGIRFHDVRTMQSSLEEIFVDLVQKIG